MSGEIDLDERQTEYRRAVAWCIEMAQAFERDVYDTDYAQCIYDIKLALEAAQAGEPLPEWVR